MKVAYNKSAMIANNTLTRNDNKLAKSLQRLSSGLKLANAKDNPSGLAMAKRMNAQLRGLSEATQNASDGISVIETADGAMAEIQDMLQRISELGVKASNGTLEAADREKINDEVIQLKEEIARIAKDTEFNGQKLLDGSFDLKGYTNNLDVKVAYYSEGVRTDHYVISNLQVAFDNRGNINLAATQTGSHLNGTGGTPSDFPPDAVITSARDNVLTIEGSQGFKIQLEVEVPATLPTAVSYNNLDVDITGIGAMDTQIGANEGQVLEIRIQEISLKSLGLEKADFSTETGAKEGLESVEKAIAYMSEARSNLGAYQNRLEHTVSTLDITSENMTSAYSRIMDVDMATEMTEYTTYQVLSQASTAMLTQANQRPSQVLQLLQ